MQDSLLFPEDENKVAPVARNPLRKFFAAGLQVRQAGLALRVAMGGDWASSGHELRGLDEGYLRPWRDQAECSQANPSFLYVATAQLHCYR